MNVTPLAGTRADSLRADAGVRAVIFEYARYTLDVNYSRDSARTPCRSIFAPA